MPSRRPLPSRSPEREATHRVVQAFAHLGVDIDLDPRPLLRRQIQHLVLVAAQHDALQLHGQFGDVARPRRHPVAVVVLVTVAVALGKGQEAMPQGMSHELQQRKEIPWPVGERRARQHVHHRIDFPVHDQASRQPTALRTVVLEIVALVEDDARESVREQPFDVALQEIVVDHHPAPKTGWRRWLGAYHPGVGLAERQVDLAYPVVFHGRRTDDEPGARWFGLDHGDDGLASLAEAHVVGKDRPATPRAGSRRPPPGAGRGRGRSHAPGLWRHSDPWSRAATTGRGETETPMESSVAEKICGAADGTTAPPASYSPKARRTEIPKIRGSVTK